MADAWLACVLNSPQNAASKGPDIRLALNLAAGSNDGHTSSRKESNEEPISARNTQRGNVVRNGSSDTMALANAGAGPRESHRNASDAIQPIRTAPIQPMLSPSLRINTQGAFTPNLTGYAASPAGSVDPFFGTRGGDWMLSQSPRFTFSSAPESPGHRIAMAGTKRKWPHATSSGRQLPVEAEWSEPESHDPGTPHAAAMEQKAGTEDTDTETDEDVPLVTGNESRSIRSKQTAGNGADRAPSAGPRQHARKGKPAPSKSPPKKKKKKSKSGGAPRSSRRSHRKSTAERSDTSAKESLAPQEQQQARVAAHRPMPVIVAGGYRGRARNQQDNVATGYSDGEAGAMQTQRGAPDAYADPSQAHSAVTALDGPGRAPVQIPARVRPRVARPSHASVVNPTPRLSSANSATVHPLSVSPMADAHLPLGSRSSAIGVPVSDTAPVAAMSYDEMEIPAGVPYGPNREMTRRELISKYQATIKQTVEEVTRATGRMTGRASVTPPPPPTASASASASPSCRQPAALGSGAAQGSSAAANESDEIWKCPICETTGFQDRRSHIVDCARNRGMTPMMGALLEFFELTDGEPVSSGAAPTVIVRPTIPTPERPLRVVAQADHTAHTTPNDPGAFLTQGTHDQGHQHAVRRAESMVRRSLQSRSDFLRQQSAANAPQSSPEPTESQHVRPTVAVAAAPAADLTDEPLEHTQVVEAATVIGDSCRHHSQPVVNSLRNASDAAGPEQMHEVGDHVPTHHLMFSIKGHHAVQRHMQADEEVSHLRDKWHCPNGCGKTLKLRSVKSQRKHLEACPNHPSHCSVTCPRHVGPTRSERSEFVRRCRKAKLQMYVNQMLEFHHHGVDTSAYGMPLWMGLNSSDAARTLNAELERANVAIAQSEAAAEVAAHAGAGSNGGDHPHHPLTQGAWQPQHVEAQDSCE